MLLGWIWRQKRWLTFHCCHIGLQVFVQFGSFRLTNNRKNMKTESWRLLKFRKCLVNNPSWNICRPSACWTLPPSPQTQHLGSHRLCQVSARPARQTNKTNKQTNISQSISHPAASQSVNQLILTDWSGDEKKERDLFGCRELNEVVG